MEICFVKFLIFTLELQIQEQFTLVLRVEHTKEYPIYIPVACPVT